jgi:hypothetical protein
MATSVTASGAIRLAPGTRSPAWRQCRHQADHSDLAFNIAEVAPVLVLIGVIVFRSSNDGCGRNLGGSASASG